MAGKVLITGAKGFIGQSLAASLSAAGYSVHCPALDLGDYSSIHRAISPEGWDFVIHLAAMSNVPRCEADPAEAYRTNLNGTALLLEALRKTNSAAHVIFASTAQVYAAPTGEELAQGVIFDESRRADPQNVYARTKWLSELLLLDYAKKQDVPATVLRLFNHTHKTQTSDFFLPHLYHSLNSIKLNGGPQHVSVGNLGVARDIGGIQDLLRAFRAVIELKPKQNVSEVFNVCSGQVKTLKHLAEKLAERLDVRAEFRIDPSRVRPGEARSICGSNEKLASATGWRPRILSDDDLIDSFLEDIL